MAAVPTAQALVELHLAGCPLDFATTFEEGERLLAAKRYSDILIGHLFAESRIFEFAAIDLSVRQLGCECFMDLTAEEIPEHQRSVFDDLLRACRENAQPL